MRKFIVALCAFVAINGVIFACEKCDKIKDYIYRAYDLSNELYYLEENDEISRIYYQQQKVYIDLIAYIQYLESED